MTHGILRCMFLIVLALAAGPAARGQFVTDPNVAIFNYQMKSNTPDWLWLEKGLADMATTDFARRRIAVVARDEMQLIATQLAVAPEVAGLDETRIDKIKERLRIHYVVTGVYSVRDNRLTLTGQIIDVRTHQEVLRKEVAGPVDQVLHLQARLTTQLLAFFQNAGSQPPGPELVPWTLSVPAAKALYEGIHLFDQGRYGEAWLRFRQAAATDPEYTDARYWTARMYYFMNRYEHARLAYEKFIYLDASHPRMGDALTEYLHTYEALDTPPPQLLEMYDRLADQFPDVVIHTELRRRFPTLNRRWLELRSAQVLGQSGRPKEAVERAGRGDHNTRVWGTTLAERNLMLHHMLTGELTVPPIVAEAFGAGTFVQFSKEHPEVTIADVQSPDIYNWYVLAAPPGHVLTSLRVFPIGNGVRTRFGAHLHKDDYGDVPSPGEMPFPQAAREGLLFDRVPRSGLFEFHTWLTEGNPRDPGVAMMEHPHSNGPPINYMRDRVILTAVRLVAEFAPIGECGTIDVSCNSTQNFRVDVDGHMGRQGAGLIGLIPPGTHELCFYSAAKIVGYPTMDQLLARSPFGFWKTRVTVLAGAVTPVLGQLPWRPESPWSAWTPPVLVGRAYPGYYLNDDRPWVRPRLLLEDQAIRMVWCYRGDIFSAFSTDGATFTPPVKLPMPVSTVWSEEAPVCLRDHASRYVLAFLSNRDAAHEPRAYWCWSRDFMHWSEPAMVLDQPVAAFDLIQDDAGRYLFTAVTQRETMRDFGGMHLPTGLYVSAISVSQSGDAYQWQKLGQVEIPERVRDVRMTQRADGGFDMVSVIELARQHTAQHQPNRADNVGIMHSADAAGWTPWKKLVELPSWTYTSISLARPDHCGILACFTSANRAEPLQVQFQIEQPDGSWSLAPSCGGMASYDGSLAYHPRWGYVLAWALPASSQFPIGPFGPFVTRGKSLPGGVNRQLNPTRETK